MIPKIGNVLHSLTIPSTQQVVQYRSFIVKEHKALLQALELGSPDVFVNTITNIIESCVQDDIDLNKLTQYDVDYIFLNIRAKSVGELVPVRFTCMNTIHKNVQPSEGEVTFEDELNEDGTLTVTDTCNTKINIELNLNDIKVVMPKDFTKKKVVKFDESSGIKLKSPNFKHFRSLFNESSHRESGFNAGEFENELIFGCVESIYQDDKVYTPGRDFTLDEFKEFLSNAPISVLKAINEFFENIPYVALQTKIKCPMCGKEQSTEIRSLEDFFV